MELRFCPNCGFDCGAVEEKPQVIATTKTDNIDEILSDLYALRAGLSAISCLFDDAVQIIHENNLERIEFYESEFRDDQKSARRAELFDKWFMNWKSYRLEEHELVFNLYLKFSHGYIGCENEGYRDYYMSKFSYMEDIEDVERNKKMLTYDNHCEIFNNLIDRDFNKEKSRKIRMEAKISDLKRQYDELSAIHFLKRKKINEAIDLINGSFVLYDLLCNFRNKWATSLERVSKKTTQIALQARKINKSLVENYSQVLDERDWKYLDLVIYYFESGRAKTMQEALIQVDKQVRHEELIETIESATRQICRTIEISADRIISQIKTSTAQLLEAVVYHNALIKKANETSAELVEATSRLAALLRN